LLVANPNVIEKALTPAFYLNFAYLADLVYVPQNSKSKGLTLEIFYLRADKSSKDVTDFVQKLLIIEKESGAEVRLRKVGERYFETFKGSGRLQRRELEIELSPDQFNTLWPGTEGRRIENPLSNRRGRPKTRA
jgi:hypothetical protein